MAKSVLRKLWLVFLSLAGLYVVLILQDTFFPSKEAMKVRADEEYRKSVEALVEADRIALDRFKREAD